MCSRKYTYKNTLFKRQVFFGYVSCGACLINIYVHNFSNFYIQFTTCISSPIACFITLKPFEKYFKNDSKFKISFKNCFSGLYGRPVRSTGPISGQIGRPSGRPGLVALVCTSVHVCRSTGPVDQQTCGRPTA